MKLTTPIPAQTVNLLTLLDFCKGFAIILVILVHYWGGWGWQGVHVFIVLSGFGLTYSRLKRSQPLPWRRWLVRRLRRILPAYWLICLFGYLTMVWIHFLNGHSLLQSLWVQKRLPLLQLALLHNFDFSTVITVPNFSLWFVPFIISFYLVFPWIYRLIVRRQKSKTLLVVLMGFVGLELLYRSIALYYLDGSPIGYRNFEELFPRLGLPFNNLPDRFPFFFQGEATFSFVPARIGEFALGMAAAVLLIRDRHTFQQRLLNRWTAGLGLLIWLVGNTLLKQGFWGWVAADLVIAIGLILLVVNLANFFQQYWAIGFEQISLLGTWSYYIFLTHFIFIYLLLIALPSETGIDLRALETTPWMAFGIEATMIGIIGLGTGLSCQLLKQWDQSKWSDWLIQRSIGKLLLR